MPKAAANKKDLCKTYNEFKNFEGAQEESDVNWKWRKFILYA